MMVIFLIDIDMIHPFANFHQSPIFILSFLLVVILTSFFFVHNFKEFLKLFWLPQCWHLFKVVCTTMEMNNMLFFKNAIEISYRW
jgi:hypothetical protein